MSCCNGDEKVYFLWATLDKKEKKRSTSRKHGGFADPSAIAKPEERRRKAPGITPVVSLITHKKKRNPWNIAGPAKQFKPAK